MGPTAALPLSAVTPALAASQGAASSARLVDFMAAVGYLPTAADRHFWVAASEMARLSNISLETLLTDRGHQIAECRCLCFHLLTQLGEVATRDVSRRFAKTEKSVHRGVAHVAGVLRAPEHHKPVVALYNALKQSFSEYLTTPIHAR